MALIAETAYINISMTKALMNNAMGRAMWQHFRMVQAFLINILVPIANGVEAGAEMGIAAAILMKTEITANMIALIGRQGLGGLAILVAGSSPDIGRFIAKIFMGII